MAFNYILKVEHEGILRRVVSSRSGEDNLSFGEVEARVRDVFNLPINAQVKLTYRDVDNDVVTMANDQDLTDACVTQKLNPLRLQLTLLSPDSNTSPATADTEFGTPKSQETGADSKDTTFDAETLAETIIMSFAPYFMDLLPLEQIPDMMDHIVNKVKAKLSVNAENVVSSDNATGATAQSNVHDAGKAKEPVTHMGVQCDACQMNPIVGPRFKSIKKYNYDLCGLCHEKEGHPEEFNRIEFPSTPSMINSVPMTSLIPASAVLPTGIRMLPLLGFGCSTRRRMTPGY